MSGLSSNAGRDRDPGGRRPAKRPAAAMLTLALALTAVPAAAQTGDRWVADETEAKATLPAPRGNEAITGGRLSCAEQRWTLELTADGAVDPVQGTLLTVDGREFALGVVGGDGMLLRVPREAIEPLKGGLRMEVSLSVGAPDGVVAFSLRGSRIAITAAEDRCSLRDMTGYTPVTFTPYSSYMNLARELRADDIKAFVQSTATQPDLSAAMADFEDGRRLLFTRLCGSSWYFGASGCNVTGFAPGDAEGEWRIVYDTENVHLHTDPQSMRQGWPDIATLPARSAGAGSVWRWNGGQYEFAGELPDAPEKLGLRPGRD